MKESKAKKKDNFWIILLMVILLAVLSRMFIFEFINISGDSMHPTLNDGQLIFIWKMSYTPLRGDIVVFESPDGTELVKRVVGLQGETIQIIEGVLYINNQKSDEKIQYNTPSSESMAPVTIPLGSVFVMGDNRKFSTDSRVFGAIPYQMIKGKMIFQLW